MGYSYIRSMIGVTSAWFTFADGIELFNFPFDWSVFEYMAITLMPQTYQNNLGNDIIVKCIGGRYSMDDLYPLQEQAGKSGYNTLVIFNTHQRVTLGVSSSGRQFHASVLAPFAEVVLEDSVGYVDGYIIAKSFRQRDTVQAGAVRLNGNCFARGNMGMLTCSAGPNTAGNIACPDSATSRNKLTSPPPPPRMTPAPAPSPGCSDQIRRRRCEKKRSRGKCSRRRIREVKCRATCEHCNDAISARSSTTG